MITNSLFLGTRSSLKVKKGSERWELGKEIPTSVLTSYHRSCQLTTNGSHPTLSIQNSTHFGVADAVWLISPSRKNGMELFMVNPFGVLDCLIISIKVAQINFVILIDFRQGGLTVHDKCR